MFDTKEQDGDAIPAEEPADLPPSRTPPLRLAGIDEDELWEPHVVRGID